MTLYFNVLQEAYLGYATIFICLGCGFLFLRHSVSGLVGPGYWAASFFLCSAGFFFWSGVLPLVSWQYFLAGEIAHMVGFLTLFWGVYRYTGGQFQWWNLGVLGLWLAFWLAGIGLVPKHPEVGMVVAKLARAVLFVGAAVLILTRIPNRSLAGRRFSSWGMLAWGTYIVFSALIKLPESTALSHLTFGILVGFQVVASLGLVVLVVDGLRIRAEDSETRVDRLEGLLPICSYCKKIRDPENHWYPIEQYIEERSKADFTHGICPDCVEKYYPGLVPKP